MTEEEIRKLKQGKDLREEEEEMKKQKEKPVEIKKEEVAAPKEEKELPPIAEQIIEEENKFRESSPVNLRASTKSHILFQSKGSKLLSMYYNTK